jgi:hypothetical protein
MNKDGNVNKKQEIKVICFNNFYKNPYDIRIYLLNQHFNYNEESYTFNFSNSLFLKTPVIFLKKIMGNDIIIESNDFIINLKNETVIDNVNNNNWTAIVFLTELSRISSGIKFYKLEDKSNFILEDEIGNIFNRIVIFKSKYHNSMGGFGNNINNGNLYQKILFSVNNV